MGSTIGRKARSIQRVTLIHKDNTRDNSMSMTQQAVKVSINSTSNGLDNNKAVSNRTGSKVVVITTTDGTTTDENISCSSTRSCRHCGSGSPLTCKGEGSSYDATSRTTSTDTPTSTHYATYTQTRISIAQTTITGALQKAHSRY